MSGTTPGHALHWPGMFRLACVVGLLGGCDTVFQLERPAVQAHDEDGDGVVDELDPCPHLAHEIVLDNDHDGVPADCDSDDNQPGTVTKFYPLVTDLGDLTVAGTLSYDTPDEVGLGSIVDGLTTLEVPSVASGTVQLEVGFEIVENSVEDHQMGDWSEVGLYAAHRMFTKSLRGDNCFFGVDPPPATPPLYLEMNEDDTRAASNVVATGRYDGTRGRLRLQRSPQRMACDVIRGEGTALHHEFAVTSLASTVGSVAISAERVKVQLRYVFVAYQP